MNTLFSLIAGLSLSMVIAFSSDQGQISTADGPRYIVTDNDTSQESHTRDGEFHWD